MQFVYGFDHRHPQAPRQLNDLLGGKGANLAEMASVLQLPVPPGFTITTEACRRYLVDGHWPAELAEQVQAATRSLEQTMGKRLGDDHDPLLVSVRSGAKFSMPGMMDTVLDLGLNDGSVEGLARQTGDDRFAWDSYRRFVQMFGQVVLGVPAEAFHTARDTIGHRPGVDRDDDLSASALVELTAAYKALVHEHSGSPFPEDPMVQLHEAIDAVFSSWNSPRARAYRNREHIDHHLGTAVNVQVMVFGNRDEHSGTGVGFTRDPATGQQGIYGDFLLRAQGEDVVAGTHQTRPLADLKDVFPDIYVQLNDIFARLERHYRDMLDTEFTIEQGQLWMLQTRIGKRTGTAALRMATDMVQDPDIQLSRAEAVGRITADHLDQVLHPQFAAVDDEQVITTGLGASPGAAVGRAYFTADDAVAAHTRGENVILVRNETSPEDVHGMQIAEGILTARGGVVSHAAVVARGWGKPAVVGAENLQVHADRFEVDGHIIHQGDIISIDGQTGSVVAGEVALRPADAPEALDTILRWADEIRGDRIAIRANADHPEDAEMARSYGADGIGLCRTEHMFFGERLPIVRHLILATTPEEEQAALDQLVDAQRDDFLPLLRAMDGLPVTVRLLDAPLHEFLPDHDHLVRAQALGELSDEEAEMLAASDAWRETNPMLGTRGVRLAILKAALYRTQTRALMQAVAERVAQGGTPIVEIMVPLVVDRAELALVRGWIDEEIRQMTGTIPNVSIAVGAMVETPRAALQAAELAHEADFFSFGTNDLTQMSFGFSRDDVEGRVVPTYLEHRILAADPFKTLDRHGVGELIQIALERGRRTKPDLAVGVCGEHGGDPASIDFFVEAGLDYISCSPFRVPVARLSAAQALSAVGGG